MKYNFNYCWHFKLADAFPLKDALEKHKDSAGRYFYERDYRETDWQEVSLPHTFNDEDLFVNRIKDAGSGQKRTCSFYRKWVDLSDQPRDSKILLAFEGVRQTCYLYVNGRMAGYCENGVAPFGFDITEYVDFEQENLIAVASDNTCTRDIALCIAETPNKPDVEPGSYLASQEEHAVPQQEGVGYFWNCNDFNPSVGGITRPVELFVKPKVYLTLPLYSNLQTGGVYVYGTDFDTEKNTARVCVSAEVRNETAADVKARLKVTVETLDGTCARTFYSEETNVPAVGEVKPRLSITPEDAYGEEYLTDEAAAENPYEGETVAGTSAEGGSAADGKECTSREGENGKARTLKHYIPREEDEVAPTVSDSVKVTVVSAESETLQLRFWNIEDPYLYRVRVELECGGEVIDEETIETGFREVGYDKDRGVLINGHRVWLTGYAQRAANEWPAIGIAPQWLKDQDMMWVKESNSNHIRWMHVAASPADIRSCDRHGVVVTQPAGDKEAENFGRRWDQRVELMRDVIIAFRNHPSILFWEAGNNRINAAHMREMTLLKRKLDPSGGRFMGCRTLNTEEDVAESEYVGTMLNRHAARAWAEHGPLTETEYSREEAARRVWDDFTPPDYDFRGRYLGKGGKKQPGKDFYDLTMEDLILAEAKGYAEFFNDRIGGASGKNMYSAAAALCWTDSAQHGRQAYSENCRMSGRVDAIRIPKQNFAVYQAMQSKTPMVKIIGHWNYPQEGADTYRYPLKEFNGEYWEETGEYAYRDPKHKTVYVAASYDILKVELFVNGQSVGVSEKPIDGFIFPIEGVDVTQSGEVTAVGYRKDEGCEAGEGLAAWDGMDSAGEPTVPDAARCGAQTTWKPAARDTVYTVGEPTALRLSVHTAPDGLLADGADIAYLDVEVVDRDGRRCPLCADRIDFETEGAALFLGGYNSGRFKGFGKDDSVIHRNYVYAECGCNRVFLRSLTQAGPIRVKAVMKSLQAEAEFVSVPVPVLPLGMPREHGMYETYAETAPVIKDAFLPNPDADVMKYEAADQDYCKVMINGQEPDSRGVPSVNKNGSVWGNVLVLLERMKGAWKDEFEYRFDAGVGKLEVTSGELKLVAQVGQTFLTVNGKENLMDGAPYMVGDQLVMEVNALLPWIANTSCQYDEKIHALRVERLVQRL